MIYPNKTIDTSQTILFLKFKIDIKFIYGHGKRNCFENVQTSTTTDRESPFSTKITIRKSYNKHMFPIGTTARVMIDDEV